MKNLGLLVVMLCMAALAACSSGGGSGQPQPVPSEFNAIVAISGSVRVSANAGSADPGTTVRVTAGGSGEGTAAADGSVSFDANLSAVRQAGSITISYQKNGSSISSDAQAYEQDDFISHNRIATGSGPNDMLHSGGSLFIANSFDNSVIRYGLDGSEQASALLAQFSSPSHLAADAGSLFVVSNGTNQLHRLSLADLSFNETQDVYQLTDPAAVFIGPAALAVHDGIAYVPRSQVLEFPEFGSGDPTTYGDGQFSAVNFNSAAPTGSEHTCQGRNPQYITCNPVREELIVICGGELNFSADATPYVSTSSIIEFYDIDEDPELLASIDMGEIGAGVLAISADGAIGYMGNALNGKLYKLDLAGHSVLRGESNPIALTSEFTYISDVEFSNDGRYVLASSFNTDELFIVPTSTDVPGSGTYPDPIDMSQGQDLLAGAAAIEIDSEGNVWVLNAIANSVNRVRLLP